MSDAIRPQKVPSGAIYRWCRQAFELSCRQPMIWLCMISLFALLSYFVEKSKIATYIVGMVALASCCALASAIDCRHSRGVKDIFSVVFSSTSLSLYNAIVGVLFMFLGGLLFFGFSDDTFALLYSDAARPAQSYNGFFVFILGFLDPFVKGVMGAVLISSIPLVSMMHGFLCSRHFGLGHFSAQKLAFSGCAINGDQFGNVVFVIGGGFLASLLLLPVLVLPMTCFSGCLLYVSFREIFLAVGSNAAVERAAGVVDGLVKPVA